MCNILNEEFKLKKNNKDKIKNSGNCHRKSLSPEPLSILCQRGTEGGRKQLAGTGIREEEKQNSKIQPPSFRDPGALGNRKGLIHNWSQCRKQLCKLPSPKVSYVKSDMSNVPFILLELYFLQPKINKNDESQVILTENG